VDEFGYAIFIDLHGHGYSKQRLLLGYRLWKEELNTNYYDPNGTDDFISKSSINNLLVMNDLLNEEAGENLRNLLSGEMAFGTLIEDQGIAAVPSEEDPFPLKDNGYFIGGYMTKEYTSDRYPNVFGFQIETNYRGVRDNEVSIAAFGASFTEAIITYLSEHTNYHPES